MINLAELHLKKEGQTMTSQDIANADQKQASNQVSEKKIFMKKKRNEWTVAAAQVCNNEARVNLTLGISSGYTISGSEEEKTCFLYFPIWELPMKMSTL